MEQLLKISNVVQPNEEYASFDSGFVVELTLRVQAKMGEVYYQVPPPHSSSIGTELRQGSITPAEIIIALGSAGLFTAVYQAISSYLTRNEGREIQLSKGKVSITVKGHSLPDEMQLLRELAPELLVKVEKKEKRENRNKNTTNRVKH